MDKQGNGLNVAVIGGGINGICTADALAGDGHRVTLFERGRLMDETSSNSTKLLHGGLRYLETGQLRLVHEALIERAWWLENCPEFAHPLRIALPVYTGISRPAWMIAAGLVLYRLLAGSRQIGGWQWQGAAEFSRQNPGLRGEGLRGGFYFYDGQMNDRALGLWMADKARAQGVKILENHEVELIDTDARLVAAGVEHRFDAVVNVSGPWAALLAQRSGLEPAYRIDWVRGSHLLFAGHNPQAMLLQVPQEDRIFFVLPYEGRTMVGTTEVPQSSAEPIEISDAEIDYLLQAYNRYFRERKTRADIIGTFSGVRPLLHFAGGPTRASREYAIARQSRLITVFGGKWTTARALGRKVSRMLRESPPPPR